MLLGNGIVFSQTFEALSFDGFGDKIKLPPSCFQELSDQGALDKGPMHFRLSMVPSDSDANVQGGHRVTHSGVLEFTARDGSVELPPHVWGNLLSGVCLDVPLIEVRYVSLPKGTYAKLQPEGMGFSDIPNHKAVLETTLRRHATLSEGDIITVSYGELNYKLRVLELKPASSVSVLETDIEVDIEGPNSASNDIGKEHVLTPLVMGKIEEGIVDKGECNYYKFIVEDAMSDKIASDQINIEIKLNADGNGDTNVYVSRHPMIFPTQHRHEWSSHEMGSKALIIRPKDPNLVAGTYSIGVFGFEGVTRYTISVAYKDNVKQKVGEHVTVPSQVDAECVECQNCKHYISSRTILLHEAYCIRHNVLCQYNGCGVVLRKEEVANHVHCDKCGQAFQQAQLEKHMRVFHEPLHCPCGVTLETEQMVCNLFHDYFLCAIGLYAVANLGSGFAFIPSCATTI